MSTWLLVVVVVAVVLGAFLGGWLVSRRTGWLVELHDAVDRLAAGDLTARVSPGGPVPARRLGAALNRLAVRMEHLVDAQRMRSADLAHRLRTPLTALRLGVDAMPDRVAAGRLTADLLVLGAAVDEVIRNVRWGRPSMAPPWADLAAVVAERVDFWSALAEDTGRTVTVSLPDRAVWVRAERADLRATVDAPLGNVVAYTPNGTPMAIVVRATAAGGVLVIDDSGPGFGDPGGVRRGRSGAASTGLGLDIARRTAEGSGGFMRLGSSPTGGARVELRFAETEQ